MRLTKKSVTRCFELKSLYRVTTVQWGLQSPAKLVGFYNKGLCCPLMTQSFTALVVQAKKGCAGVRMLRKHEMGGGDEEKDKCIAGRLKATG